MEYTNQECIEALRKANEMVDGKLTKREYIRLGIKPSAITQQDRFGSWNEAKEAAGLETINQYGEYDHVPFRTTNIYSNYGSSYEVWETTSNYEVQKMFVHRLLAISEYGIEAVKDMTIHHINGISWDNRPDNIEVLTKVEHASKHKRRGGLVDPPTP